MPFKTQQLDKQNYCSLALVLKIKSITSLGATSMPLSVCYTKPVNIHPRINKVVEFHARTYWSESKI